MKFDLSPIRKLIINIATIPTATTKLFVFFKIKKLIKNRAKPWTKAPATSSSPKKLATLPIKVVEKPRVLNPKITSKRQSLKTIKIIIDQILNTFTKSFKLYLLNILNVSITNKIINKNLIILKIELLGIWLKNKFINKEIKKNIRI